MKESDKDLLIIKRDALLKKKRLLDAIEKLRQQAGSDQVQLETNCEYVVEATGVQEWKPLMSLINSINQKDIVSLQVDDDLNHGFGWGYNKVVITLGTKFDKFSKKIRDEYHTLDKKVGKERPDESRTYKWVHYTNPFWLLLTSVKLLWKHKIISLLVAIISFLAIDFALAWRNILWLVVFIKDFF